MGKLIGYARTSTDEQSAGLEAQIVALKAAGCDKIFHEQVSSVRERGQLDRALDYVRGGDTLIVTKVDRLVRSTVALWQIVERLDRMEDGGVGLRILNLGGETVDTKSATGKLILTIFAGFAQFEREMMLERQAAGIAAAKKAGAYKGRAVSRNRSLAVEMIKGGATITQVASALNMGRASVYRAVDEATVG